MKQSLPLTLFAQIENSFGEWVQDHRQQFIPKTYNSKTFHKWVLDYSLKFAYLNFVCKKNPFTDLLNTYRPAPTMDVYNNDVWDLLTKTISAWHVAWMTLLFVCIITLWTLVYTMFVQQDEVWRTRCTVVWPRTSTC